MTSNGFPIRLQIQESLFSLYIFPIDFMGGIREQKASKIDFEVFW